jgi:hypothetical protein
MFGSGAGISIGEGSLGKKSALSQILSRKDRIEAS